MRTFRTPPHSANPRMRPTRAVQAPSMPTASSVRSGASHACHARSSICAWRRLPLGSTARARRIKLDGSSSTAALQHAQEAVEPKAISISSKAALQRTWGGYSEAIDGIAGSTPARSRRLRAPDSAQRRAPRKSCIAPPECPPLFDARRLARKARPARQASL